MVKGIGIETKGKAGPKGLVLRLSADANLRTVVGRRVSLLFANLHMSGLSNPELHKKILGFEFQYRNYLCVQDSTKDFYYVFYDTTSAKEEAKLIAQKGRGLKFAKSVIERSVATGTEAVDFAKSIENADLRAKSDREIMGLFEDYVERICALMPITVITAAVELTVEEELKKGLMERTKDDHKISSAMVRLTAPDRYNVPYEEQISILKIANEMKSGKGTADSVKRHLERYGWLGYRFDFGQFWTEQDIVKRAKEISGPGEQLEFLGKKEALVKKEFNDTVKQLKLDAELVEMANAAKEFVWLRTYRTDAINEAVGRAKPLIDEIGRRYKLPEGYSHYLTIDEISSGRIPKAAEIAKRMKCYSLAFVGIEGFLLTGVNVDPIREFAETDLMGLAGKPARVKGMVANRPVESIEGIARVVNSVTDVDNVRVGDILVAPMTEPNFVPAMEKAAAFVTDEGGLLCHAAIISREMNKPCIIGTGNATKLLKDGDAILLDLRDGTVTKASGKPLRIKLESAEKKYKESATESLPTRQEAIQTDLDTMLVVPFERLRKEHIHIAGGKGANLGEMFSRFPIPRGFCVTVNSYKHFIKENGLDTKIFKMLGKLNPKDNKSLDSTSEQIRKLINSAPIPDDVRKQIVEGYKKLKGSYVAVRSSATAEDLPNFSFAGQQDTYLNIKGDAALLDAVRRCWASLFTSRAIYYRALNKFEHEKSTYRLWCRT